MKDEFVDLRRSSLSSESFWPSFTDIMMVVVIIFLLTSMLLMVKNWELLDQLRNSMAAEEKAVKIIQDTSLENATLEEQLAYAQDEISMLRMRMLQMNEHSSQLASELDERDRKLVIILSEKDNLDQAVKQRDEQLMDLNSKMTSMDNMLSAMKIDAEEKQRAIEEERRNMIIITGERDEQARRLSALEEDYDSLKVKYDKLVKPARTAKGKHVAVVDYERIDGKARIRLKESESSEYILVSEKQLHQKLSLLKKKHPGKLYIRIIIPEKSGLTYSEAWTFMRGLLKKYDYYYQE